MGVLMATGYASGPLGYIVAGPVVQRFGAEPTFLAIGVVFALVSLATLFMPAIRDFDEPGGFESELGITDLKPPASDSAL